MGLSGAVDWWEEWQLRILVIGSQCIQWFLFLSAIRRKSIVSASFRVLIWLAYLASDAVAIYALAALFNRHRKEQRNTLGESVLEVVWAPVLLMHLGGQDCITAYNMEDNELWRRHALTAVSQITVSIYVFCKSWRGGDKKLLQAAIMLFTLGGIRCLEKPFALQKASINSLVSSSDTILQSLSDNKGSSYRISSLQVYVKQLWGLYQPPSDEAQGKNDGETPRDPTDQAGVEGVTMAPEHLSGQPQVQVCIVDSKPLPDQAHVEVNTEAPNYLHNQAQGNNDGETPKDPTDQARVEGVTMAPKHLSGQPQVEVCIVDSKPPPDQTHVEVNTEVPSHIPRQAQGEGQASYHHKKSCPRPRLEDQVNKLFVDLASPYHDRLGATKFFLDLEEEKAYKELQKRLSGTFDLLYTKAKMSLPSIEKEDNRFWLLAQCFRFACVILPFAAIGLFYQSHKDAYNDKDVKITYTLFCCTAVMELFSYKRDLGSKLSGMVAQYSFMGYFARNKKYTKRMSILSSLKCKEYVDQQWSMKPSSSSFRITILVRQQVIGWWKQHIQDAAAYTRFNKNRGQWAIQEAGCAKVLGWSIRRSFDESVLLWHIAMDLCFFNMGIRSEHHVTAMGCREISNYMMYLLFAKPEMLMAGTRRNLLIVAYRQLDDMLVSEKEPPVDEREVAKRLIAKVEIEPNKYIAKVKCGQKRLEHEQQEQIAKVERAQQEQIAKVERAQQEQIAKVGHEQKEQIAKMQLEHKKQINKMLLEQKEQMAKVEVEQKRQIASVEEYLKGRYLIHDAWVLAKALLDLNDEEKMWKVMEGVWVEMLCYSASSCRGYLHAKSLGTGGELLTFVWLLWSFMGMETLAERMQTPDVELPSEDETKAPSEEENIAPRQEENRGADELGDLLAEGVGSFVETFREISGFD